MKRFLQSIGIVLGAVLFSATIVSATPISVPSAPSAGYGLISTSTGAYIAVTPGALSPEITVCRSGCDYTTDGTADDVQIQQAIDSTTTPTVVLFNEVYDINAPITITKSNVAIIGHGFGTILKSKINFNDYVFKVSDTSLRANLVFKDFKIDGNLLNQTSGGAIMASSTTASNFDSIWLTACKVVCLKISGTAAGSFSSNNVITNSQFDNAGSVGIWFASTTDENSLIGNQISDFSLYSVFDEGGTQNISANKFIGGLTAATGVMIYSKNDNTIVTGNTLDGPHGEGIKIEASKAVVTNNRISKVAGGTASSTIMLKTGAGNLVSNNVIDGGAYYPYALECVSSINNTVWGNSFTAGTTGTNNCSSSIDHVGSLVLMDSTNSKSYRLRTSGSSLDFDAAAATMYLSNYSGAGFTGTQNFYLGLSSGSHDADAFGNWRFHDVPFASTIVSILPTDTYPLQVTGNAIFSGYVGIGITTPSSKLTIRDTTVGDATNPTVLITGDGSFAKTSIYLKVLGNAVTDSGTTTQITNLGTGTSLEVKGQSDGSTTKGHCFKIKEVGANTFGYMYMNSAGTMVSSNTSCSGTGTTTTVWD